MIRLRRVIGTAFARFGLFVVDLRWVLLSSAVTIVGVVAAFTLIPQWILVVVAVISLLLLVGDLVARHRRAEQMKFTHRNRDDFEDVREAIMGSKRVELWQVENGTFLFDRVASAAIGAGNVVAKLAAKGYETRPELKAVGESFRREYIAARPKAYNGAVAGLNTNLGYGSGDMPNTVTIVRSDYFHYVESDVMAMDDVRNGDEFSSQFGRNLFIDARGVPRDFGDSWLLNGVGTSIIAITKDGKFVLVVQTDKNDTSGGLSAPSGSGSLEHNDFLKANSLRLDELVMNGALREMSEEARIPAHQVASAHFLGFGRWMEKAAKAEAFSIAFLNVASDDLDSRRLESYERPFTYGREIVKFDQPMSEWSPKHPDRMVKASVRRRLSLPVAVSLRLLAEAVQDPSSPVTNQMEEALQRNHF